MVKVALLQYQPLRLLTVCYAQFLRRVFQFLLERWTADQHYPQCIIIHVGSNDLVILPKKVMFQSVKHILAQTRELLPHTITFCSQILPRVGHASAMKQNKFERVQHAIN